jgi:hypothetical protein
MMELKKEQRKYENGNYCQTRKEIPGKRRVDNVVCQRRKFKVLNNVFPGHQNPYEREANQKQTEENDQQKDIFHRQQDLTFELIW